MEVASVLRKWGKVGGLIMDNWYGLTKWNKEKALHVHYQGG